MKPDTCNESSTSDTWSSDGPFITSATCSSDESRTTSGTCSSDEPCRTSGTCSSDGFLTSQSCSTYGPLDEPWIEQKQQNLYRRSLYGI